MATEIGPIFATADCRLDSLAATETNPVAVAPELVLLYLFHFISFITTQQHDTMFRKQMHKIFKSREMSFKSHKCFDIISFKLLSSRMFKLKNIF